MEKVEKRDLGGRGCLRGPQGLGALLGGAMGAVGKGLPALPHGRGLLGAPLGGGGQDAGGIGGGFYCSPTL